MDDQQEYDLRMFEAAMFAKALPDAKERRRYALLQAAAVIYTEAVSSEDLCKGISATQVDRVHAAVHAEELLAEIERRES